MAFTLDEWSTSSIEKIASQYENSQLFKKWINVYLNEANNVCGAVCQFVDFFDIDSASGKWLDVIGRIVGMPRLAIDSTKLDIFGFDGDITNFGFDVGVFTDGVYGTGNVDSSDLIYKRMIRAKVLKNVSNCSIPDLVKSIMILSERDDFTFIDTGSPMQVGIQFGGSGVDGTSLLLLEDMDLLPLACGVKLTQVI